MASSLDFDGGLVCSMSVKDMKASIEWYRDVLELELLFAREDIGWCEFKTETANVQIGLSEVEEPKGQGGAVPTFGVKDIEKSRAKLEERDVRFDGPTFEIPGLVKLATFYDPDGNTFMFYQDMR